MVRGKEELCFEHENGQLETEHVYKTVAVESHVPGFQNPLAIDQMQCSDAL